MRTDFIYHIVPKMIDTVVEKTLPEGTCSMERWLTFDLEAIGDPSMSDETDTSPNSFRYLAQYSRPGGYTYWRTVLPGTEPHVQVADYCDDTSYPETPWMPASSGRRGKQVFGMDNVAPGYVIANGAHDSCWRDHGMQMEGYPRIDTGRTWHREDTGWSGKVYDQTRYFYWPKAVTVRVHRVTLKGPVHYVYGKPPADRQALLDAQQDGEWVNPDPEGLTGPWALLVALAHLYHCAGHEGPLQMGLDTTYVYYRPTKPEDTDRTNGRTGLTETQRRRDTVWYRFDSEGMVTAVGQGHVKWEVEWEDCTPFRLTREEHLRRLGASEKKIRDNLVGIDSMWDRNF